MKFRQKIIVAGRTYSADNQQAGDTGNVPIIDIAIGSCQL
ncbi:hypothetical protein CFU_1090 [Collimonas fungivorans Ter331]|uniref:Uncharacterized protein n=1 Tax=Collimonas fungivorans (strain Ter331) TaxID=1005048 RepID=G0AIY9_COLFT|nr:hypothetical protein CFU_1090 [Collimonas fungivorans Ter331]